ncbi:hypothetical protein L1049_021056 [Liquidambar formosana]|uniref:Copine C-terminal domain-containing protein n=1 Tax=Liquidambar formosana TaxID=63359 RepID=A0AAP0SDK4_LIQFO
METCATCRGDVEKVCNGSGDRREEKRGADLGEERRGGDVQLQKCLRELIFSFRSESKGSHHECLNPNEKELGKADVYMRGKQSYELCPLLQRRFPAWGFGGKTYNGAVSHCFNLNGSASGFEVEGVEGIMAAYASALHNVALAGPTLFGQVINKAAEIAGQSLSLDDNKYFASDADNGCRLESSTGRVATRDIVQFVPMLEVYIILASGQISIVQALLEELPGQFLT